MEEERALTLFAPLFGEIKRRLYNADDAPTWSKKCSEFIRALSVKNLEADGGGLPAELDAMWHEALLNTRLYGALCIYLRGQFIHHETTSENNDDDARLSRVDETVLAYRKRYREEPDPRYWDDHLLLDVVPPAHKYQVFVRALNGRTKTLQVEANTTILGIKTLIQQLEGIPPTHQRLIYGGSLLVDDNKTVWDYAIVPESTLQLCLRVSGC